MHLSLNDPPGVAYCRIFRKDNTSVQSEGMPVFAADEAGALQGRDEKVATKPQGIITVRTIKPQELIEFQHRYYDNRGYFPSPALWLT